MEEEVPISHSFSRPSEHTCYILHSKSLEERKEGGSVASAGPPSLHPSGNNRPPSGASTPRGPRRSGCGRRRTFVRIRVGLAAIRVGGGGLAVRICRRLARGIGNLRWLLRASRGALRGAFGFAAARPGRAFRVGRALRRRVRRKARGHSRHHSSSGWMSAQVGGIMHRACTATETACWLSLQILDTCRRARPGDKIHLQDPPA